MFIFGMIKNIVEFKKNIIMTKVFSLMLCALIFGTAMKINAQTTISCDQRTYCKWDEYLDEYNDCDSWEDNSLFEINESETMFTHTTSSMKSSYYIKSQKASKNSDGERIVICDVISDVGNKYIYMSFVLKVDISMP